MSPREIITIAKDYVADLYRDEGAMNFGLEELRFDDVSRVWEVTIGFSRQWDLGAGQRMSQMFEPKPLPRTYKVVEIRDSDGGVLGMKQGPLAA